MGNCSTFFMLELVGNLSLRELLEFKVILRAYLVKVK
jgi:hypothetical protein